MTASILATCIFLASQQYHVPPAILIGILKVEGGTVGQEVGPNTNGTYDLGPMQINTVWLEELSKKYNISINRVHKEKEFDFSKINKINENKIPIILCGGGRKNKFLLKNISKHTKYNLINIDNLGINGDYVESQAFAYLAIRSYLKKYISFPSTTGVKLPVTGGEMFENF